ncbi:expressed unknown protein [Seminavis robusta]|uniref:Transmembrane protein n=1 Tax=Seminavis robusta TaxID=568900 RepID=A0A9N8H6N0_9STRA|nr:expressed unknown protein [Seminavis robusta]|eukprot:Sro104_g052980.1 n/a (158) ;mRNA; r:93327-93800
MAVAKDKLWHFLASLGMVWFFFAGLSLIDHCFFPRTTTQNEHSAENAEPDEEKQELETQSPSIASDRQEKQEQPTTVFQTILQSTTRCILLASFLSFVVGAAKEFADVIWNGWPWCTNGVCHGDGWDILANLVGIIVGAAILFLATSIRVWMVAKNQ